MKVVCAVLAILLAVVGYYQIRYPEDAIYLENFWRYDSFEPSENYIRITKFRGFVAILGAVFCTIFAFAI